MSRVENGWGNAAQRQHNDSNVDDVHGAMGREGVVGCGNGSNQHRPTTSQACLDRRRCGTSGATESATTVRFLLCMVPWGQRGVVGFSSGSNQDKLMTNQYAQVGGCDEVLPRRRRRDEGTGGVQDKTRDTSCERLNSGHTRHKPWETQLNNKLGLVM
jgi:hypothetical protein